jgi:cysteine-rich repeat protein
MRLQIPLLLRAIGLLASLLPVGVEAAQCGFVQGAADFENTCGVRADGGLQCWGERYPHLFPSQLPAGRFQSVAIYEGGGCALRTDGSAACWGDVSVGVLAPPAGAFTQMVVEYEHACGLRTDGSAECWGSGPASNAPETAFTQITSGPGYSCGLREDSTVECWGSGPAALPPSGPFSSISGGYDTACGIRGDGTVECWGDFPASPEGQFSAIDAEFIDGCGLRTDGTVLCWSRYFGDYSPVTGPFVQVWSGGQHACALRADGSVECWGSNESTESTPPALWQRIALSYGNTSACGRRHDGRWRCWGEVGNDSDIGEFVDIAIGSPYADSDYACGLRSDGTARCWGADALAYGTAPPGQFRQIVAGGVHACGLRPDGSADCWGVNTYGAAFDRPGPFTQVSAGETFNCGLRVDGTIECWGHDVYDQLDAPSGTFTQVAAGRDHACAIRDDATVACWGGNGVVPLDGPPPGTFASIAAGALVTCGVRTDGTVACWGRDIIDEAPPGGEFASVSAALRYACGVRPNGDLVCWGNYPNATTDDCAACGDGSPATVEECDDGNLTPNDGCSDLCEIDCATTPLAGCRTATRSQLLIRSTDDDPSRSRLKWKWAKGEATTIPELSDPILDGRYNVCFYPDASSGQSILVPTRASWTLRNDSYRYLDKALQHGPIVSLEIRPGDESKAAVSIKGQGQGLPSSLLPATSYVAQLVDTGTGICWSSSFPVGTSTPTSFRARSTQ